MTNWVQHRWFLVVFLLLGVQSASAQYSVQHQAPSAFVEGESTRLEFVVPGLSLGEVQEAILYYRVDEGFSYQQEELFFRNGSFVSDLTISGQNSTVVEYYFVLRLLSGVDLSFPQSTPDENPLRVEIVRSENDEEEMERITAVDYNILTPKDGEAYASNDAVIALSLYYDVNELQPGEFRLFLDDRDVTEQADTSAYFISYLPKGLRNGPHDVRVEYHTEGDEYLVAKWGFRIVDPDQVGYASLTGERRRPVGRIELGARNQIISGDVNNAYTARTSLSGNYGIMRYSVNGYFTSQESSRLQPQNRFGFIVDVGQWLRMEGGHVYPRFGNFTINGRRIYGLNTEAHLLSENLNMQFIYGQLDRSVTNLYSSLEVEQDSLNGVVVDTTYTLTYQNQGRGTFKRDIIGGRLAFGKVEKFQLGLQAIKVQDDTTSIFNVQNFNDLNPANYTQLTNEDIAKLTDNPELLQIQNGGIQPRGNLIAGMDLKMGFANNRIRVESEGMISALNNDIYGGYLTVERADELGFELDPDEVDLLSRISRFIIINENMDVLPLRISNVDTDSATADPYFPTSILATNNELSLNYPSNDLRIQYRWIGPDFYSLANSTIRRDIAGYTVSDRFRLFENRVYITLGYEKLEDNVAGTKDATTESKTYRSNVSWYPIDKKLPRVSMGLRYRTRENGVDRFNPYVPADLVNFTVQNFVISGTDTLLSTVPRDNKTVNLTASITQQFEAIDAIHDASLSLSDLTTTDEVFAFGDVNSSSVSLNLTSRFENLPLTTQFGMTFNNTETGSGQTDINIFGLYAGGNYFMLDRRLNLNGRIALTSSTSTILPLIIDPNSQLDNVSENDYYSLDSVNPITNDYNTYVLQLGAQYDLNEHHTFIFDSNLTNVSSEVGNDRIVQVRYRFNF